MPFIFSTIPVVIEQKDVIVGAICDNCSAVLRPVFVDEHGVWGSCSAENSIGLTLIGGHGRYFDAPDLHLQICFDCVRRLTLLFPGIGKALSRHC